MNKTIKFKVNSETREIDVKSNETLLDVLRYKLGLKTPKCGCNMGDCGTCTIIYNNKTVRSCLILAIEAEDAEIITLEGLNRTGLSSLQQAFLEKNSFQCGFCAPGIILTTTELLEKNPHPSREEIQEALSGNLCRCTGYIPIIEAIESIYKKDNFGEDV